VILLLSLAALLLPSGSACSETLRRPNVILIMTDDQGYGDFGFTGNPIVQTPNIDRLSSEGTLLTNFCVCPVCTPTRASLMTGRYNFRTRAIDTYRGRAMMDPDEVTLAEMLKAEGYATGIFGKWHLGDCYPMRAMDQGFSETLVLRGGGLAQPSDPPDSTGYFDPILFKNGEPVKTSGYCSDIFTDAAIDFVERNREGPFFLYLPFNAPHEPLQVPDRYYQMYKDKVQSASQFPSIGHPLEGEFNPNATAKLYGMVTNIDDNVGRLLARLDDLEIAENTVVIFLTDNGPQRVRYKAGFRGLKGSVYEGGIRTPCIVRWKGKAWHKQVDVPLAHIDITPTVREICGLTPPTIPRLDGESFFGQLTCDDCWRSMRTLFFQWHRGDEPELYRAFAARGPRYKLVRSEGAKDENPVGEPTFELFDLKEDPYEMKDISSEKPEEVEKLKKEYEAWFKNVSASRGYDPPRIALGDPHQKLVELTRQDWRGAQSEWKPEGLGYWEVRVAKKAEYGVTMLFDKTEGPASIHFQLNGASLDRDLPFGSDRYNFDRVAIEPGEGRLEAWVMEANRKLGVRYVDVKDLD
jgi:arylsulfatase A-like enzyme